MAEIQQVLIKRTIDPNSPPGALEPGELAVEMAEPTRLWVGVPVELDPTGKKLLIDLSISTGTVYVGDAPPVLRAQGDLWYESDTGILWIYYDDGNTQQWVQLNGISGSTGEGGGGGLPPGTDYVDTTGDTMTGLLRVNMPGGGMLVLNKGASTGANQIRGESVNLARWTMYLGDGVAESATDRVGSDFSLWAHNNAGDATQAAFRINRLNDATFARNVTVTGSETVLGAVVLGSNPTNYSLWRSADNQSHLHFGSGNIYIIWNPNGPGGGAYSWSGNSIGSVGLEMRADNNLTWSGVGAYKPGGGPWIDGSDARIKNVVGTYDSGLEQIMSLSPMRYTYKGNDTSLAPAHIPDSMAEMEGREQEDKGPVVVPYPNSKHYDVAVEAHEFIGLIAQEAEIGMPEIVTQREGYIDGVAVTDFRDIDQGPILFALINAVKELKAFNDVLTSRIAVLEKKPTK